MVAVESLLFAFSAGTATFFAPCAFPLLPGYVAFYLGTDDGDAVPATTRLRRAVGVSAFVVLGFFLVYAVLVGLLLAVGARALANVSVLELVVGGVLVVVGTAMALGKSPSVHVTLPERRRGPTGFVLFGVVYAAAAAGCTAGVFAPLALRALTAGSAAAVGMLAAYAAGMSLMMVGVTLLAAVGKSAVLRAVSRQTGRISRVAGVVLVVAGLAQIHYFVVVVDGLSTLGV